MEYILRRIHKLGIFGLLYSITFLNALHLAAIDFVNSSLLEQYISQTKIGFLYATSSLLMLIFLRLITVFLKRFGAYRVSLTVISIDFLATLELAYSKEVHWIFIFFILHTVASIIILFCFDIFLENYAQNDNKKGFFRGLFLSISASASLLSPVISGLVIGNNAQYENAYIISALYLIPVILFFVTSFKKFPDPKYKTLSLAQTIKRVRAHRNIFHISFTQFLLRFYFFWMMVYLPIYLHKNIGFSWPEIGVILFVMLLPYMFIEFPAGIIADKWLGEKELLLTGFFITIISTAFLSFLTVKSIFVWGGILFVTRIGTALIDSMSETYFFKKVDGDEASMLSEFRMLRPLAYGIGAISTGLLLLFCPLQYLWILLALCMFLGIFSVHALTDTK